MRAQWVNLSPYEKGRIIKDNFGKTEMGRDLLAQDYLLKQITSTLIYPQGGLGKKFWDTIYERAWKEYGTTQVPINTFNKVWIVPDDALIYEKGNVAYILKHHLKVMLEEDYLSLQKHSDINENVIPANLHRGTDAGIQNKNNKLHSIGSQIIKEIILPELEKEVNKGKNFAPLRQVYSGMLLAAWYKRALKESFLATIYADKAKVKGINQAPVNNEQIYKRYLFAFKKGVFNFIKEDVDQYTHETIPRKYFSGGTEGDNALITKMGFDSIRTKMLSPDQARQVSQELNKDEIVESKVAEFKSPAMMVTPDSSIKDLGLSDKDYQWVRSMILWRLRVDDGEFDVEDILFKGSQQGKEITAQLVEKGYLSYTSEERFFAKFNKDISAIRSSIRRDFPESYSFILPVLEERYKVKQEYEKRTVSIKELIAFRARDLFGHNKPALLRRLREALASCGFILKGDKPLEPHTITIESNVSVLDLSTGTSNILNNANIETIGQLVEKTVDRFTEIPQPGKDQFG